MSVSATATVQILEARFIRAPLYLNGDASGGTAIWTWNIPRGYRLLRARLDFQIGGAVNLGSPVVTLRPPVLNSPIVSWEFVYSDGAALRVFYTTDIPLELFPRSQAEGETALRSVQAAMSNNVVLVGAATLYGEVEEVGKTLRRAQRSWSPNDFFKRLDGWLFGGQPEGFSTP